MKWDDCLFEIYLIKSLNENETKITKKWFAKRAKKKSIDDVIRTSFFSQNWSHSSRSAIRKELKLNYRVWSYKKTKHRLMLLNIKHSSFFFIKLNVFCDPKILSIWIWSNRADHEWSVVQFVKMLSHLVWSLSQYKFVHETSYHRRKFSNELKEFFVT
jgi:hypothetical protein